MQSRDPLAPANLMLADYLCFVVYSANLAFGKVCKPLLEALGRTYTQYIALIALWEEEHQTVGGPGEKLFLESDTLTTILKRLKVMGYLERQRDRRRASGASQAHEKRSTAARKSPDYESRRSDWPRARRVR